MKLGELNVLPMTDKAFLKLKYSIEMGEKINLDNPRTFDEKLQWLKLYNRKDLYTTMVDKYEAKDYVSSIIGKEYVIPTLGVYENFDQIDFGELPNRFVIKCTHDSGGLFIVKDKKSLNIDEVRRKIEKCLKRNYYYCGREWPYKNVKPRIIIEKYMVDESGYELKDYKFFCFGGKVHYIQVDFDRFKGHKKNIYDRNWKFQNVQINYPNSPDCNIKKPVQLKKMIEFAEKLSKDQPFLRVDFYDIKGKIYFGELTFFPGSGFMTFDPKEWNRKLGDLIELELSLKKKEINGK